MNGLMTERDGSRAGCARRSRQFCLVFAFIVSVPSKPRTANIRTCLAFRQLDQPRQGQLAPSRVLHFNALAILMTRLIPRDWPERRIPSCAR